MHTRAGAKAQPKALFEFRQGIESLPRHFTPPQKRRPTSRGFVQN